MTCRRPVTLRLIGRQAGREPARRQDWRPRSLISGLDGPGRLGRALQIFQSSSFTPSMIMA